MHPSPTEELRVVSILCIGIENSDGQKRVTETDDFLLVGGSALTHRRMQATAQLFEETLEQRGKTLAETDFEEVMDLLSRARAAASGRSELD